MCLGFKPRRWRIDGADKSTELCAPSPTSIHSELKKWAITSLFIFIFVFSIQWTENKWMSDMKVCQWLDSNCGPLASEATAQPTKPQPLPHINSLWADVVVDVFLKRSGLEEFLNFYIKLHHDWSSSTFPIPKFESYYSIKVFSFSLSSISPFLTFKSAPTLLQHRRPNL